MLRECGASSTPRPMGLIIDVSGILDVRPRAQLRTRRMMTVNVDQRSRGALRPRFASDVPSSRTRVQGMPGACCTRGLVCNMRKKNAHEHTGTAEALRHSLRNGLTAYAALSLETNSSCLHRCRLDG
jgi:hypothetical protein